jgi:hypothetical protein
VAQVAGEDRAIDGEILLHFVTVVRPGGCERGGRAKWRGFV